MSNLPTDRNNNSVTPFNFFNLFDQLENMVINSFQSALAPINNTAFEDKGNEYVFTLTLKNLKREDIQLNVENQQLILTIHQLRRKILFNLIKVSPLAKLLVFTTSMLIKLLPR